MNVFRDIHEASGYASYETISASWKYELLSALPSCILLIMCGAAFFHLMQNQRQEADAA